MEQQHYPPIQPTRRRRTLRIAGMLCAALLLLAACIGWRFFSAAAKATNESLLSTITSTFTSTRLQGEDTGHVTILLAGNSADDSGHGGALLTDSIMLMDINTQNNTATTLSIPRDLWVNIPGYGYSKINAAYAYGETNHFHEIGYAEGGMGLLEKTLNETLGIRVHYYALVDYAAVKNIVNTLGGVDVTIDSSDPRGLYDANFQASEGGPLRLANGVQHLDGQTALKLARARGSTYNSYGFAGSDFTRTANQRALLDAIKTKAVSSSTLANPLKLNGLFDAFGSDVQTNFTLGEGRRLYELAKSNAPMQSVSLQDDSTHLLRNYTTYNGQSALIPAAGLNNFAFIKTFIAQKIYNSNN
jgi:LCP family protein required for cell wall assembly